MPHYRNGVLVDEPWKPMVSEYRKPEADNNPCNVCHGTGLRHREGAHYTCKRCTGTGVERPNHA